MTLTLLPRFADVIRNSPRFDLSSSGADHPLLLDEIDVRGKVVRMLYAPFDHVNHDARVIIVGMTPGAVQAENALAAAKRELDKGKPLERAAETAKVHASFSGEPMRGNLVRMMDRVGIAKLLGIHTTASLWGEHTDLVHFSSALRYPVFVDGKNWSGAPDMVRTERMREWLLAYTGAELARLTDAVIVPLGPKVAAAMAFLADEGLIDRDRVLDGMPHPSGANQERVSSFLGDKADSLCSPKTNPKAIAAARTSLAARIAQLGNG